MRDSMFIQKALKLKDISMLQQHSWLAGSVHTPGHAMLCQRLLLVLVRCSVCLVASVVLKCMMEQFLLLWNLYRIFFSNSSLLPPVVFLYKSWCPQPKTATKCWTMNCSLRAKLVSVWITTSYRTSFFRCIIYG